MSTRNAEELLCVSEFSGPPYHAQGSVRDLLFLICELSHGNDPTSGLGHAHSPRFTDSRRGKMAGDLKLGTRGEVS